MPTVRPGYLTETPSTTFALGRSSTRARQIAFPLTPGYSDYTDAAVRATFSRPAEVSGEGLETMISDGGYMFGSAPRLYKDTPNLADVPIGGGGKPGSPFAPNIAVRSHNPADIPDDGVIATEEERTKSNGAFVGNGLVSPSATVRGIVPRTLGQTLQNGVGSGDSFRIRIV